MGPFKKHLKFNISFIVIVIGLLYVIVVSQPPKDFPTKKFTFEVAKGTSIGEVASGLHEKHVINSELIFKITSIILSRNNGLKAGDYKFSGKESTFTIVKRMVGGDQRQLKVRITIPEGTNVSDMAFILLKALPDFNAPLFVSLAKPKEGYLYPDTYNFFENVKPTEVIKTMEKNFDEKIKPIEKDIKEFGKSFEDIITMASIVEKEANGDEDRKIISGILWKRIKEGMLLQVDPPFYYITGKTGGVTFDDLKIKSPYNTYLNKGLPKGPITNPGIESIKATINPISTKYYFYLTGKDGKMYYATTYDGHLLNISKYLRNNK